MTYKVAENIFEVIDGGSMCWESIKGHYAPFTTEEGDVCVSVDIVKGTITDYSGWTLVHDDSKPRAEDVCLRVYKKADKHLLFEIVQPGETQAYAWLEFDLTTKKAIATIDEDNPKAIAWKLIASTTCAMQLAYMLATIDRNTVMTHSSCIINSGKAYLFLGKSGTGKSTHSRMWAESIPGTELLNDDHPIIRIGEGSTVRVYGSPWSGKTHCYRNLSAPVGAIVRIRRASSNSIRPLSVIEAYASLTTSLFSTPFDETMSDMRHATLERIVTTVPSYELSCLPNHAAAQVCRQGIESHEDHDTE